MGRFCRKILHFFTPAAAPLASISREISKQSRRGGRVLVCFGGVCGCVTGSTVIKKGVLSYTKGYRENCWVFLPVLVYIFAGCPVLKWLQSMAKCRAWLALRGGRYGGVPCLAVGLTVTGREKGGSRFTV